MTSLKLLTTSQASVILGIKPCTVRLYCREGRLPALKIGRDWMLQEGAVEAFRRIPRPVGAPKRGYR